MIPSARRNSPVQKQLEAYEESWKSEHNAAMRCRYGEEAIAAGLAVLRFLREWEDQWRERVFRGTLEFDPEENAEFRDRLADWLSVTDGALGNWVAKLETRYGTVEGAEQLREAATDIRITLETWKPPSLSIAVGLREMTLTPEAVAELDHIIAEAEVNPTPMPQGPRMRQMSTAEFMERTARR